MRRMLLFTFGLIVLGWAMFAAAPTEAATSAGPYYAPPAWDQKLQCDTEATCPRFIILSNFTGEEPGPGGTTIVTTVAVLDRETGLVWERSPSTSPFDWEGAQLHCNQLSKGNRFGWRLPTIQELASLVDPSVPLPGFFPSGHPFSNPQPSYYWSATTYADLTGLAWAVDFRVQADPRFRVTVGGYKSNEYPAWCVRGGHGIDLQ